MISVVIPAYNEQEYIGENTLKIMKELEKIGDKYEILIVEESKDKTPQIASELDKKYKTIRHFHSDKRLGKGRAIEYGIARAKGDKIIFTDIDLATDPSLIPTMVGELDKYDVVVGSRYHPDSKSKRTFLRLFLGRSYSLFPRVMLGVGLRDFQCGFKGFRKSAAKKIIKYTASSGVFWDTELLFFAKNLGFTIKEIPVDWTEKKGRSVKIGIGTIYTFAFSVLLLMIRNILGSKLRKN